MGTFLWRLFHFSFFPYHAWKKVNGRTSAPLIFRRVTIPLILISSSLHFLSLLSMNGSIIRHVIFFVVYLLSGGIASWTTVLLIGQTRTIFELNINHLFIVFAFGTIPYFLLQTGSYWIAQDSIWQEFFFLAKCYFYYVFYLGYRRFSSNRRESLSYALIIGSVFFIIAETIRYLTVLLVSPQPIVL